MQLVQIRMVHSHALVNLVSLETEHTVQISTNVMAVHATQMQHAATWLDHTHVLVSLDTQAMGHFVKTSMNAVYHLLATQMQPVITLLGHTHVGANLVILEMELIVMVSDIT